MEFRILGPVVVVDGDRVLTLPRPKQRALVAFLVLHTGRIMSTDRLLEELWNGRPTARNSLWNNVNKVRQLLAPELLVTAQPGYRLDVALEQTDLGRFEQLTARAREATDAAERRALLRAALAEWRGEPFENLGLDFEFALLERERLRELHLAARRDLVDTEVRLGNEAGVLGELHALVDERPDDELVCGWLMLALYRAGRQADALEAYRRAYATLHENGLEPSHELKELERKILNHDPSLLRPQKPAVTAETQRKTVTVLFADLAEPAAGGGLDPEQLTVLGDRLSAAVDAAAARHGGTTERLADGSVMAVFGVPAAHEDDALRAVRATTEAREAIRGAAVEARLGVGTGEVLVRGGGVLGTAVVTARRLEHAAGPDEILLSAGTLALVRGAVRTEPIEAGGHNAGPPAFRLLSFVEGSQAIDRRPHAPLVGRTAELAELRAAFDAVRDVGRARLFTVSGDAGIGKTRLAAELCEAVRDEAMVLVGRCAPYGEGGAYSPVEEIVEQAGDELAHVLAAAGSVGEEHLRLRAYFESRAGEQPVLIVLEDAHWAEPALLDLVESFAAQAVEAPILVLCLARPDLLEERPGWPVDAVLMPLGEDETVALLEQIPGEVETGLVSRIARTAEGNPLYAEQLLAFAADGGRLESVPPGIEALLASRLDRLEPDERALLRRAAVVGREFDARTVARLAAPVETAAIDGALAELERLGLVRRTSRHLCRFEHLLVRDVAYAALPKAERGELHQRVADLLDGGPDEVVGYHLEQAFRYVTELGGSDGAARRLALDAGKHLGDAGLRAWKRGDTPAATNLLARATALLPVEAKMRLGFRCELGVALRAAGELEQADGVLADAQAAAAAANDRPAELRARLELANVRLLRDPAGRPAELLAAAEEAIPVFEAVGDDHLLTRAWHLRAHVEGAWQCSYAASVESAERALAHCTLSGWSTGACLGDLAAALYEGPTPADAALRRCRELLRGADLGGEANVLVHLGGLEAMLGRVADGRRHVLRSQELYEELGQPALGQVNCGQMLGAIELLDGNPHAAAQVFGASCEALEKMGERAYLATRAAQLADALYLTGERDEAWRWSRLAEESATPDDAPTQYLWRSGRAKLLASKGSGDEAVALAGEARRLVARTDALNQHAQVLLDLAEVMRLAGRPRAARNAATKALALFEQKGNVVAAAQVRALLGRP
jgi:DNA-binding SARP family transcriptional activator